MRILRFAVKNYKSFADSGGEATLSSGINVVAGQNNVGKTALLEALSARLKGIPHRSLRTHPIPSAVVNVQPTVEIDYTLTKQEVLELVADNGGHFVLPAVDADASNAIINLERSLTPEGTFRCVYGAAPPNATLLRYPYSSGQRLHLSVQRPQLEFRPVSGGPVPGDLAQIVMSVMPNHIYLFGAERYSVGEYSFGHTTVLQPNAQNLAEVINVLHASPAKLRQLNELVREVLPQIRWISAQAIENNRVRLLVWTIDPEIGRTDLAIPLSESGTGVGQVLAILYVVTQTMTPRVIIVDEPQSFLHPGAIRKLLAILRRYPQHQFVISTHSPVALTAAEPGTTLLVTQVNGISRIETLRLDEAKAVRVLLAELGVRLEDVFGFDRILWVEGKTEEMCFPVILERLCQASLAGTGIVGLIATGDFESRHGDLAFEIYGRLSTTSPLMPPSVAFILDRERRSERDVANLLARGGGMVRFLPRRMFENYLLQPSAIAAVLSGIDGVGTVTAAAVEEWLDRNRWNAALFAPGPPPVDRTAESWNQHVAGGLVLQRLFVELSEARVVYDKVQHGLALTEVLIANEPSTLTSLAEFLCDLVRPA